MSYYNQHTEIYYDSTGTANWFGVSGNLVPISIQEIPINRSNRSIYECSKCGRRMHVDWSKTGAVFVLECSSCGSQDLELIQ